jgi:hypothetical protein
MMQEIQTLSQAAVEVGDVFLSLGRGDLSAGIHRLDGGDYSHAALWSGDSVIEATLPAVREVPLAALTERSEYVDVYRPLTSRAPHVVVEASRRYVKRPYGAVNLAVCTLATTVTSWLPGDWSKLNVLLELGELGRMIEIVSELTRSATQTASVTCVELVGRSYSESGSPLAVRLDNPGTFDADLFVKAVRDLARRVPKGAIAASADPIRATEDLQWLSNLQLANSPTSIEDASPWQPARETWLQSLRAQSAEGAPTVPKRSSAVVPQLLELPAAQIRKMELVVGVDWPAALLTPRLLQTSPSLKLVGRLRQGP